MRTAVAAGVTEHRRAVELGRRRVEELRRLFRHLGSVDAPGGRILSAYRAARLALRGHLDNASAVRDVLRSLRQVLANEGEELFQAASALGARQADRELTLYGVLAPNGKDEADIARALESWMSLVDAQLDAVYAFVAGGWGGEAEILGDEEQAGALSPSGVIREGARWAAILAALAYLSRTSRALQGRGAEDAFRRQAVAAIDARTTDCCLRVHGQVVGLKENFRLTGTPRFAPEMHDPPFHWYCRTATVLVRAEMAEDEVTVEMREAARAEREARERTGVRAPIRPSNAFSGRGS